MMMVVLYWNFNEDDDDHDDHFYWNHHRHRLLALNEDYDDELMTIVIITINSHFITIATDSCCSHDNINIKGVTGVVITTFTFIFHFHPDN